MSDKAPNFASILDESPTEVVRPKPLPTGTYVFRVSGTPEFGESRQKKTKFVKFNTIVVAPHTDVDEDELEEMGGGIGNKMSLTFYLTEGSAYRLDEFHSHCGIDLSDGQTRAKRNEEVMNAEFLGQVIHEISPDGSQVYAKLNRTFPME